MADPESRSSQSGRNPFVEVDPDPDSGVGVQDRLRRLAELARSLTGAKYAAVGVPDEEGDFAQFVTAGMSEELIDAIGPLPRSHGLLGAVLTEGRVERSDDIGADPRFQWWPAAHPKMKAFLGVPVWLDDQVIGALYLADREDGLPFDDRDQAAAESLVKQMTLTLESVRLHDRRLELLVVGERNRLAGELHDSVTQTLFSANLLAETALAQLGPDSEQSASQLRRLQQLCQQALDELRAIVYELRPPDLESEGLVPTLRRHVEVVRRVTAVPVELKVTGERRVRGRAERELLRIGQEALGNAVRHSGASVIRIALDLAGPLARLEVTDDGVGFDLSAPGLRSRHLGLTSMEERARSLGGRLGLSTAPGAGTTVQAEVPVG